MKEKLVSKEMARGIHPVFRGRFGNLLIKLAFKISGANKLNAVYDGSKHLTGVDFAEDVLNKLEIKRVYKNREVLNQFEGQPFITVSNHPYGHIDGVMTIAAMGSVRSDYKIMVNWILKQIDTLEEFFIGVNPFPKDAKVSQVKGSTGGVKLSVEHLEEGHPLGLFPAGGISLPSLSGNVVDDEWKTSTVRLIKNARVPIIPVHISGSNSLMFQLLGYISWKVRTIRLLHEVTNKRGKTITMTFGDPITVEEQDKYENIKEFGKFLKAKTYALKE